MSPELDEQLVKRYPMLYSQRGRSMTETCMCWGFECGDGWYDLINELSAGIEDINEKIMFRKKSDKWLSIGFSIVACFSVVFVFAFGGRDQFMDSVVAVIGLLSLLGIYINSRKTYSFIEASQVKEKFACLRFYYDGGAGYEEDTDDLIASAERKSAITCESCGKPGRPNNTGWITTLCDDCRCVRFGTRPRR